MSMARLGTGIGLVLSLLLFRGLGTVLYGVKSFDPITLSSLLLLMAFLASYMPALRATHVDRVVALREE